MAYPTTPVTLVSRLKDSSQGNRWHEDWRRFVKDYRDAVEASVHAAFAKYNWRAVDQQTVEETVAEVFVRFVKRQIETPYDPEKGYLRSFLRQLSEWSVTDHVRRHARRPQHEPLEVIGEEDSAEAVPTSAVAAQDIARWEEEADQAHERAVLALLLDDVRDRVSPRAFAIFDAVKLQHRSPDEVAAEFDVNRHVIDNSVHKVLNRLRELAQTPDYRKEIES